jgi:D-aminoacyl-tRNA deacylase
MKAVVQRVTHAEVEVEGAVVSRIEAGLLVLLGVQAGDVEADAEFLAEKITGLRIFEDAEGKMNLGILDLDPHGALLVVPNFTVCGSARKGKRPSFADAAAPDEGRRLYEEACRLMERRGAVVGRGVFGAHMHVRLVNDGPVTLWLESARSPQHGGK